MIRCKTRCRAERSEDGVALIMVVCVLAALVIIGTPFVLSMRTHELGSRRIQAGVQARFLAEAAVNRAIRMTMESHEQLERLGSDPQGVDYDLFSEFQMLMQSLDIEGQTATLRWRDSRGSLLEATIYDEQGKININSAPGFTLGNLLGVTELVEDLNPKDTEMKVRSVEGEFFSDGDPMTLDGYVRVGAELIAYRHAAGGRISGLMRGFLFSAPTPETLFHPAGTIVQDGRGQKIALHKMWARYGEWTPFETVNSIRQIADWTLLRYVEEKLLTWGVTPDDLEDYGIDLEDLMSQIGINPLRLELPEVERTDEEKAAEKALKNAGLDPEVIRLLGGAGRMQRLADMVERIPEGARSRILDRYKERQSQFEAFMKDLKKYHKDYMPQAVRDVVVLLTEAGDIEAIQASELEEIRDFITVSSSRSRAWSDVQYNQNKVQYQADMRTNYNTSIVQFPRTETIGIGTWIRIVDESTGKLSYRIGMEPEELVPPELMQTGQFQRRRGQVALWPQLTGSHQPGQLRIEAEIPHPVNLNTAHRRVIRALLVGLQGNPTVFPPPEDSQDDFVTLAEAEVLAERILGASLKGLDDLLDLLNIAVDDEVISEQDRNVILKNALNPNDPTLIVSSLPFCYRSYDVYTVEATAILNSEAGTELARHGLRQIVEVAPPSKLEWRIDSQQDFTTEVRTVAPAGDPEEDMSTMLAPDDFNRNRDRIRRLDRHSNKMITYPDPIFRDSWKFGDPSHDVLDGELRLETGSADDSGTSGSGNFTFTGGGGGGGQQFRMAMQAMRGSGRYYKHHFWQTTEGLEIEDGGLGAAAFGDSERGIPKDDLVSSQPEYSDAGTEMTGPGSVSMWIKPSSAGSNYTLFDMQDQPTLNRIHFFVEGGEIIFQIADGARDETEGGSLGLPEGRRSAEVRASIPMKKDTWYHLAATWKGPKPGEQSIILDGRSVGRASFTTQLASPLSKVSEPTGADPYLYENVFVDDNSQANGFPEEGTILIGNEAMEYYRLDGNAFRVRVRLTFDPETSQTVPYRSLPGSTPEDHEIGSVVTIFGYTNYGGSTAADGATRRWDLPEGGSNGNWGTLIHEVPPTMPSYSVNVFTINNIKKAQIILRTDRGSTIDELPAYGYITVQATLGGGPGPRPGGTQAVASELMFYTRSGNTLTCWRNAEGWSTGVIEFVDGNTVILSSVQISGATVKDYFPSEDVPKTLPPFLDEEKEGYLQLWLADKGQMQGQANLDDYDQQPPCEWIYVERPGGGNDLSYLEDIKAVTGNDLLNMGVFIVPFGGRKAYLSTSTGNPRIFQREGLSRRMGRTEAYLHGVGTTVQPVYQFQRQEIGQRDYVTVFDNQSRASEKVEKQIVHAMTFYERHYDKSPNEKDYLTGRSWSYASFGDPGWTQSSGPPKTLPRRYEARYGARIAKWPSDELPITRDHHFVTYCEQNDQSGLLSGTVDEIQVRSADTRIRPDERVALAEKLDDSMTEFFVDAPNPSNVAQYLANGGAIKIEDEVIGVANASATDDQVRLTGCVRGLLGTEPMAHAPGISANMQSYPSVSAFERLEERRMIVKSTAGFPREGYVAFDRGPAFDVDIWAYRRVRGNGRLDLCEDVRGDPTFLGGMYGTRPTAPSQGDIVVAMPYRYFDRYAPRVDSARAAYFETSRRVPGAIWRGIRWDGTTPPGTEIRVLARVDGKPDWSAEPGKPVDGHTLYLFNDPGAPNRIDEMGDQVEIRIHFTYKDGAFTRNLGQQSDEWKDTPTLRSLTVEYHRPVRVLHREEMVF